MVAWSCITKSTMKGTLCESPPTASFILPIFLHEHRWRSNGLALVGAVGRGVPRARATLFLPTSYGRGGLGSSGSTSAHATPPSGVRPITSISPQCRASPFGMTETLRVLLPSGAQNSCPCSISNRDHRCAANTVVHPLAGGGEHCEVGAYPVPNKGLHLTASSVRSSVAWSELCCCSGTRLTPVISTPTAPPLSQASACTATQSKNQCKVDGVSGGFCTGLTTVGMVDNTWTDVLSAVWSERDR
jgi:hypothetical protein